MEDEPIYINGIFIKEISDKMLIENINLTKLREFVNNNQNLISTGKSGDKFLNVKIIKRKMQGKYGDTHFAAWNEPKDHNGNSNNGSDTPPPQTEDDDLPF